MPVPAFRRNDNGLVLCSTDGCDNRATWQAPVECTECGPVAEAARQAVEEHDTDLAGQLAQVEQAASTLSTILLDAGDERRPLGRDETRQVVEAQAVMDEARAAAADAAASKRAALHQAQIHSEPHTHPLFGCDIHPQETP